MSKKSYSVSPLTAQSDRRAQDRRIAKKRDDPHFRSQMQILRQKLAGGQSLYDIRDSMGIKREIDWIDMTRCLANSFASPEYILLEWSVRQNARYAAASDMLNRARKANDFDAELKAIMLQAKIDENLLDLQKTLGLIKPIEDPKTHGTGYDSGDVSNAEIRFNKLIEQRVVRKLELQSETQRADTIDVFPGTEPRGEADQLGHATLAEDTANRSE